VLSPCYSHTNDLDFGAHKYRNNSPIHPSRNMCRLHPCYLRISGEPLLGSNISILRCCGGRLCCSQTDILRMNTNLTMLFLRQPPTQKGEVYEHGEPRPHFPSLLVIVCMAMSFTVSRLSPRAIQVVRFARNRHICTQADAQ